MISVIVPVYNVEKYLERCLNSILSQSYNDFELILVDDGSKDNSPKICDEYGAKDKRIKVIHQENQGLSVARNIGINASTGDYITYIDSDDIVHKDFLLILYNLIKKYDSQIACCNFQFFYNESELNEDNKSFSDFSLSGSEATEKVLYGSLHGSSACAILIEASISKSNLFMPGKYHEDDLISFKYFLKAKTVAVTKKPLYYYFQRDGSIMHSKYGQIAIDELNAGDYIYDNCKNYSKKLEKAALFKKYMNYCDVLLTFPDLKKLDLEIYSKVLKTLKNLRWKILVDNNCSKKIRAKSFVFCFFGLKAFVSINKLLK